MKQRVLEERKKHCMCFIAERRFVIELISGFPPIWDGSSVPGKLEVLNCTVIFESPYAHPQ